MGLHVGILRIVNLAEPVDGQLFDLVHHLATAVVTLARITFSIFVRTDGAHRFHDLVGHIILGGNEFKAGRLPVALPFDQVENLEILLHTCRKLAFVSVFPVKSDTERLTNIRKKSTFAHPCK